MTEAAPDSQAGGARTQAAATRGGAQGAAAAAQGSEAFGPSVWERRRAEWLAQLQAGAGEHTGRARPHAPVLSYADIEDLLLTMQPFPRPVPLSELVDFLVDCWDSEGLYTGLHTSSSSGEVSAAPTRQRRARVLVPPSTPGTEPLLPLGAGAAPAGAVRRRRGRPPGSRNKPRIAVGQPEVMPPQTAQPGGEAAPPLAPVMPIVRRRGRPRKVPLPPQLPPPSARARGLVAGVCFV